MKKLVAVMGILIILWVLFVNSITIENVEVQEEGCLVSINLLDSIQTYYYEF